MEWSPQPCMRDPTKLPEVVCLCGRTLSSRTAHTTRNHLRKWLSCDGCDLWIWEDVLMKYVDEVLEFLQSHATEPPKLICGCGQPATCCTGPSPLNQKNKRFFCKTCNMRIWEDTLKKFVDDMLFYCQAATIDSLTSELQNSNRVLLHKDNQIAAMEAELMKVKDEAELMKVKDEDHWKTAPSAVVEE